MPGRIGDVVTDPVLTRCEGCLKSTLECEMEMDRPGTLCCGICTHLHAPDLLARYGLLHT
jgi:hypothetical protein